MALEMGEWNPKDHGDIGRDPIKLNDDSISSKVFVIESRSRLNSKFIAEWYLFVPKEEEEEKSEELILKSRLEPAEYSSTHSRPSRSIHL